MSDMAATRGASVGEFLGHPKGLYVLFATEMWERFSYYGMRGLLIFYLTQHFLFGDEKAYAIYGAYTALVYVMPVIGGMLADRYLGPRKAVTFGAILLVLGHGLMAFEGAQSKQYVNFQGEAYEIETVGRGRLAERFLIIDGSRVAAKIGESQLRIEGDSLSGLPQEWGGDSYSLTTEKDPFFLQIFYLSLGLIISGVGFLKANISTIVGALYAPGDSRRDGGFTIFYMGINLGSFLAGIACGALGQLVGWWAGFGLAGIGMLAGLVVFLRYQDYLLGKADPPNPAILKEKVFAGISRETAIYLGGLLMVIVSWQLVQFQAFVGQLLILFGIVVFGGIVAYALSKCPPEDRDKMMVATFLILCQLPFWALFEQAGSSLNLFADRAVDLTLFGASIPAATFQSANPFFIITLGPVFAWIWVTLAKRGMEPSTPLKFSLGILQVGLGFLVLVLGMQASGPDGLTPVIFLVLIYLLHTTGELCLSPVGLSMVTKLSVKHVVGLMMGAWFLATAFANYVASIIAQYTGAETVGGEIVDLAAAKANYIDVYSNVGWVAVAIAVVLAVISPLLRKRMHDVH